MSRLFTSLFIIGSLLFITNCNLSDSDDNNSAESKPVAVKMHVQSGTTNTFKAANVDSLTEIKLLVEELKLKSVDEDSSDFEVENLVVNIPVDGDSVQLITEQIPVGTYDVFEMEIENDDDGTSTDDPDFSNGEEFYSLVIKGLYNGEPFTFRAEEDFEIELDLNPPLEITGETSSAAINISILSSTWFIDAEGNALDPNDPANYEQIEENIENSFEAESDDDDDNEDEDDDDDDNNDD